MTVIENANRACKALLQYLTGFRVVPAVRICPEWLESSL